MEKIKTAIESMLEHSQTTDELVQNIREFIEREENKITENYIAEKQSMFSREDVVDMLDQIVRLNGPFVVQKAVLKLKRLLADSYDAKSIFKSNTNFLA
jgi:hypothetical protein